MDWFFEVLDKLLQSFIWKSVISKFVLLDWMTVAFFLIGVIYGAVRGLLRCTALLLEAIAFSWLLLYFYPKLSLLLEPALKAPMKGWLPPFSFIILACILAFLMSVIDKALIKLFHTNLSAVLRVSGGMIVGVFFLMYVWSIACQGLSIFPITRLRKTFEAKHSVTGFYVVQIVPNTLSPFKNFRKKK